MRHTGAATEPLPASIGFLASHGVTREILAYAAALSSIVGVPPDEVMIRHGLIEEDTLYRALAAELHLPYRRYPRLGPGTRFPHSILAGIAPLAASRRGFVIAPRGKAMQRLLSSDRRARSGFVLTSPTALTQAVLSRRDPAVARRAAHLLADRAPRFSSRDAGTGIQLGILCFLALVLSFAGAVAPHLAVAAVSLALAPVFLVAVAFRLATAALDIATEPSEPSPRSADATLPVYSVIVPVYGEEKVLPQLLWALGRLDYPPAKLDVKFVVEADDHVTRAALARLTVPPYIQVLVAPPGFPRTKPRALNVALPLAHGAFTVVYDAEDVPDPAQLRLALAGFSRQPRHVACLQARLAIENVADSWLTRLFAIEYAALFDVFNPGIAHFDGPFPLGGTSNHFRTSVLRDVLGWDAWNVTEDADLGIRLARLGYRVGDLASTTREEAPADLRAWMRQRSRWLKGYIQTCITHSQHPVRAWRELGSWRFGVAVTLTLGTVASALGYPILTAICIVEIIAGRLRATGNPWDALWAFGSLALLSLGLMAIWVPALMGVHRRKLWRLLPWVALLPVYYLLVSAAAWLAAWELITKPFFWNKTEHGLARTSFTGAFRAASPGLAPHPLEGG